MLDLSISWEQNWDFSKFFKENENLSTESWSVCLNNRCVLETGQF